VEYLKGPNTLYLLNDAGNAWMGPLTPGVAGTQSNSQCTLDAGSSSVSGSGNTLTVTLRLTFSGSFTGTKNVYGEAVDNASRNSGWQTLGTWTP